MKRSTYILFLLIVGACSSPVVSSRKSSVSPVVSTISVIQPIDGLEIAPREFQVSADNASTIQLVNGGTITFPANAFVDENGSPVKGQVTIEWTEYHSLTDIMASGIPMSYDSAGVANHFVSGGMFTIDGEQNGKAVEIAAGKTVEVKLGTYDQQQKFNFYELDDQTGEWKYELTAKSTPNPTVSKPSSSISTVKKTSTGVMLALNVVVNPDSFPELKKDKIVGWNWDQYAADNTGNVSELLTRKNLRTKILSMEETHYLIQLTSGKDNGIIVTDPVFLHTAMAKTKEVERRTGNDMASLLQFQQNYEQAIAFRTASIEGFGTYNWDMIHMREKPVEFLAHINIPGKNNSDIVAIFHVCPEEKAVVRYSLDELPKFNYSPDKKNCLIVVYNDKDVFAASDKDFRNATNHAGEREFTFQPRKQSFKMSSPKQLGNIVERSI